MSAASEKCLLLVHAHPDDECLATGGTIARYADEGVRVVLVTCTNGEAGEIAEVPGLGGPRELRDRLGEIRVAELEEACRHLGDVDLRLLGYHDSGMAGTAENEDTRAFVNQDMDEAVLRVAEIIRGVRPQVLVTYNEYGFYGHPDHIRAHEVAMAAVVAAADEGFRSESGRSHKVAKVYFTAVPRSLLTAGRALAQHMDMSADEFFSEEEVERVATDDDEVTTAIDVSSYIDRKFAALEAHRTQLGTVAPFLKIPEEMRAFAMGTEHYVLARSDVAPLEGGETDLFRGLSD